MVADEDSGGGRALGFRSFLRALLAQVGTKSFLRILLTQTLIGAVLGLAFYAAWIIGDGDAKRFASSLITGLAGLVIGWLIGFLGSPFSWEEGKFTDYGKALSGFLTGYILSKLDPLVLAATRREGPDSDLLLFRFGLFVVCLGCGIIGMYVFRRYFAAPAMEREARST